MLVFDIETDGLLDRLTKIHTMTIYDSDTGRFTRFDKTDTAYGIERLAKADSICGHNIIGFDIPAIQRLYPGWKPPAEVVDTLVWARLVYPDVKNVDYVLFRRGAIPGQLIGRHSLEAWGYRIGELKGQYKGRPDAWDKWNPELSAYCEQDVRVTVTLVGRLEQMACSQRALDLEHQVAWILARQERHGFLFDRTAAEKLYEEWTILRLRLVEQLHRTFGEFYTCGKEFTPKRTMRRTVPGGWKELIVEGCPMTKVELEEFNPSSRFHIANRLKKLFDWVPAEFTQTGEPKIDDETLDGLPWPEAQLIRQYLTIEKRIGQLAEGDKAWLKYVNTSSGRIHGAVNPCGAVTGRMTHFAPNMAQVPAGYSPYGKECRALFIVPPGCRLVGIDAASLELCCLAHYMGDEGYTRAVTEGKKEEGTDPHTLNMRALEIDSRDTAKKWFYAFIYGAGDAKLGSILGVSPRKAGQKRKQFLKNLRAMGNLKESIEHTLTQRDYLIGLDGRHLQVRSTHSALNTLLQSAGAVIMKQALVVLDEALQQEYGLCCGKDYEFVGNIHDEWQIECLEEHAETIGKAGVAAISKAGQLFNFKCPLTGDYKIGLNWGETH